MFSLLSLFIVVFTPNYSEKNIGNVKFHFLNQKILQQLETQKSQEISKVERI